MILRKNKGFTLAELLIALAILGVIATFTIPKVLNSATSGQNTAIAKEAASMVSGAFSAYQLNNQIASTTTAGVLSQFMNYVRVDTTNTAFSAPTSGGGGTMAACNTANLVCLQLHNGAYLQYMSNNSFGGTTTTHALVYNVDPDGRGAGAGSISFIQMSNGRLTTGGNAVENTDWASTGEITAVTTDPSYLTNWN